PDLDFPGLPLALCPAGRCSCGKRHRAARPPLDTPCLSRRAGGQALCKRQALARHFDTYPFGLITHALPAVSCRETYELDHIREVPMSAGWVNLIVLVAIVLIVTGFVAIRIFAATRPAGRKKPG